MIIMPDADMDQAVDALMGAAYGAAGERCMAISVAVPIGDATADRLIEKLAPKVRALKIAPETDPDAEMGPLVTKQHIDKCFVHWAFRCLLRRAAQGSPLLVLPRRPCKENAQFMARLEHVTTATLAGRSNGSFSLLLPSGLGTGSNIS
ncbi:Aldehyde dehydrogenase family protein [Bradyrhizobium sp. Rc3b]|nr:Aldehyde dehydrogenase family protein [Bradyrhizobium sp. Rc3b]